MARNIIRNQNVLDRGSIARQPKPHERMVETFTISVWPKGMTHHDLAEELERIAALVRDGYYSGEIVNRDNDGGHWDTKEA